MNDGVSQPTNGSTKRLFDITDDGIYVVDKNLNIVAANDTATNWTRMNGYKGKIAGNNVLDVFPFLNEIAIQHIKEVIEKEKPIYTEYNWFLDSNRIIAAEIVPLYTHDASIQAVTVAKDLGESERILGGIIKRERSTRLLLEQVSDGIHVYSLDGEIVYANEALSSRLGYSPEELLKLHSSDIDISIGSLHPTKIHQELLTKRSLIYETYFATKNNQEIITEVNSNIIQYYGVEAVLSISRDISERRIAIESVEIESMRSNLEQSNRDLEIYTSLLQHDLRNDLQLVLTQVDLSILKSLPNQSEDKGLKIIQAAVDRMSKLLDMLSVSTEIEAQDLVSCFIATTFEAKKITPDFQIDLVNNTDSKSVQVLAGRLLPFVWINIFRNTIQFAGPNPQSKITITRNTERIMIDIVDNGPGVSDWIEKQLFEKGASTTGSGYGLYLCRKIVEAYGGTIELVKNSGIGAHFRVTLVAI
ncbi:MAG: PAS domain S-box protein [Candidatus Thorarchaeota archaeon]